MTLSEFLATKEIRLTPLARLLGVSVGTVHDWKTHRRTPSLAAAVAIERATGGKVKAEELLPPKPADQDKEH